MTPRQLQTYLLALLQEVLDARDLLGLPLPSHGPGQAARAIASVETFDQAELLTDDKGLIITTHNGRELRIVIRSQSTSDHTDHPPQP